MLAMACASSIVKCTECRTPGCSYRTVAGSEYCCQGCSGEIVTKGGSIPTAIGVIPDQDKFHARRGSPNAAPLKGDCRAPRHDAACAMLDMEVLRGSWWEEFRCDSLSKVDATCLVVPPADEAKWAPAPVILFLSGDGHVDDKQDFMWGGVDLLIRNPRLRERCFLVAMRPTTGSGLLRFNDRWTRTWSEDAVWAFFTEVLCRLGSARVDTSRMYATGFSLGAIGVWNLATSYGQHFAAIAPISGGCEWPNDSWPRGSDMDETVRARLEALPIRAYQVDVDHQAGKQVADMEALCRDLRENRRNLDLPGMEDGKTCSVEIREWCRKARATWELWVAKGPLTDWSAWDDWGGDKHLLWQRAYPLLEWGLADFLFSHTAPEQRCWRIDGPRATVNVQNKILDCLKKAASKVNGESATKPWAEQVQNFAQLFFESLWMTFGDRPYFDTVDYTTDIHNGIEAYLGHLHPYMNRPEFESVLRKAAHFSADKTRYFVRSWPLSSTVIEGPKWQKTIVREAVDGAREEVAKHMLTMTVDKFIEAWILKSKDNLDRSEHPDLLPCESALKLFREFAVFGGGIPVSLMAQMDGITVTDWEPLTRAVNESFCDPEPPIEKPEWADRSKGQGKRASMSVSAMPGMGGQQTMMTGRMYGGVMRKGKGQGKSASMSVSAMPGMGGQQTMTTGRMYGGVMVSAGGRPMMKGGAMGGSTPMMKCGAMMKGGAKGDNGSMMQGFGKGWGSGWNNGFMAPY